jgi:hypothetical protein
LLKKQKKMNCRAQLLSLPLTYRYLLTIVDARQLQEQFLPLRAAMLAAISTDDKEVTQTALKIASENEAEEKHASVATLNGQKMGGKLEEKLEGKQGAEVEGFLKREQVDEMEEMEEVEEAEELEEQNNEEAVTEAEEEEEDVELDLENEGDGTENDHRSQDEVEEASHTRQDAKPIRLQRERSRRSSSDSDSESKHRNEKRKDKKSAKSAPNHKGRKRDSRDSSDSEPDELFMYAQEKEAAARKLMRKFTKIRSAIRKHAQELATLQHEMAALELGEAAFNGDRGSGGGGGGHPRAKERDDLSTFEAFMEHRRKREHTHEAFEATAKRLESDKSETKQRFARNTTKLINIAAPVLDARAFTQDPDVASALEECSNNSSLVTHYLSHPVATLALTCAQLIHTKSTHAMYQTDRWRAYTAKKRA